MKSVKGEIFTKNIITKARVERQQRDCAEMPHYSHQWCQSHRHEVTTGELSEPRKRKGDVGQQPLEEPSAEGCNQPRTTRRISSLSSYSPVLWVSSTLAQLEARSQRAWDLTDVMNISQSFRTQNNLGKFREFDLEGQTEDIWHNLKFISYLPRILNPLTKIFFAISPPQRIILKMNYK